MRVSGSTILITGGGSGIGLAMAERFQAAGGEVIICGRRKDKLEEIKAKFPKFHTRRCDIAKDSERVDLMDWATKSFPNLNVLVNNAGIQRQVKLSENEPWEITREEIATNFDAPVHLCRLFIPHLLKKEHSAIVNVTSGLAFSPLAFVPVYCSTKAALRSFTISLRHQLRETPIKVIEVIPPAVNTDLGGPGLHTFGAPLNEFADSIMKRLQEGELEIPFGMAERASRASRAELSEIFAQMNQTSGYPTGTGT